MTSKAFDNVTKLRDIVSVKDFGAVGNGIVDDTASIQAAFNFAQTNNKSIFAPSGTYKITSSINYVVTSTNADTSSGLVLTGDGMGKTVFVNAVSGSPMIFISSTTPYFAKGNLLTNFTIIGDGVATNQVGIRTKGVWYFLVQNVRVIKLLGTAFVMGDDTTVQNPDVTATAYAHFNSCEIDQNFRGIDNPVNNNAVLIHLENTQLSNNTQVAVIANSSFILIDSCTISFNGSAGSPNALGGVLIEERQGTTFSAGYRMKQLVIRATEFDSNFPYSVNVQQAERVLIEQNIFSFRDYTDTWLANLPAWPSAQIQIGGSTNTKRVIGAIIRGNRVGFLTDNNIPGGFNGHTILRIGAYGHGVVWENQTFDVNSGSAVSGVDYFIIREDSKAATSSPDLSSPLYAVKYDFPYNNANPQWLQSPSAFSVNYPIIFPATFANTQYQFLMADDTAQAITVPNATSESAPGTNYGFYVITVAGAAASSDLIGYRANTSPACFKIGSASTDIDVTTGVLTGTTGVNGKFTVSAATDGKVYLENRLGSSLYVNMAFLVYPGLLNQPVF